MDCPHNRPHARTHTWISTHTHTHTHTHARTHSGFLYLPTRTSLSLPSLVVSRAQGDWGRGPGYPPTLTQLRALTEPPYRYGCAVRGQFGPAWSVWRIRLRCLTNAAGASLHSAHSHVIYHVVSPPLVEPVAHASCPTRPSRVGRDARQRQAQIEIRTSDSLVIGTWHLWWLEGERKKELRGCRFCEFSLELSSRAPFVCVRTTSHAFICLARRVLLHL